MKRIHKLLVVLGAVALAFVVTERQALAINLEDYHKGPLFARGGIMLGNKAAAGLTMASAPGPNFITQSFGTGLVSMTPTAVSAVTCSDQTLSSSVTSAQVGDPCFLALPASFIANIGAQCWVSAANTVTIRFCNPTAGSITPTSGNYSARVISSQ